ncbi:MAG: DNA polymerase III subunit delta, partial [Bacteroidia bacterium]
KVLVLHFLQDKSEKAAASALGVHPFFVKDYFTAARNYPTGKLKQIFGFLREYDLRSKGVDNVSADEGALLKELIWKILH